MFGNLVINWRTLLIVLAVAVSLLYGVSYQQFRHLDLQDPRGLNDIKSYISMSKGNYDDVTTIHKYRFIIPSLVYLISKVFNFTSDNSIGVVFYFINFLICLLLAIIFFYFLLELGFHEVEALLGMCFVISNRMIVIFSSTPLVDSLYYFGVLLICFFLVKKQYALLLILFPFIILFKETVIPFLILPLFDRDFRKKKNNLIFFVFHHSLHYYFLA